MVGNSGPGECPVGARGGTRDGGYRPRSGRSGAAGYYSPQTGAVSRSAGVRAGAARAYRSVEDREGELRAGCLLGEILQIQGKHREAFAALLELRGSLDSSSASSGAVQINLRLSEVAMDLKLFRLGALQLESGEMGAARSYLAEARGIWQRLGARKDLQRADKALTRLPPATQAASS